MVPRPPVGANAVEFDDGYGGVIMGEARATVPVPDTGATVPFGIVNGAVPGGVENVVGKALETKGIVDPVAPTPPSVGPVEAVALERVKGGLGSPENAAEGPVSVGPGNDVAFVNKNGEAIELGWLPGPSAVPLLVLVGLVNIPTVPEVELLTGYGNQVLELDPATLGTVPVGAKTEVELIVGKGAIVLGEVDVGFGLENGFLNPVLLRIVEVPVPLAGPVILVTLPVGPAVLLWFDMVKGPETQDVGRDSKGTAPVPEGIPVPVKPERSDVSKLNVSIGA